MKKKVVYLTQWIAKDTKKEYPHGYGFTAPIVDFPVDKDTGWVTKVCRENLSNDEFECYGVIPYPLLDGMFEILGEMPKDGLNYEAKALSAITNGLYISLGEAMKEIDRLKELSS